MHELESNVVDLVVTSPPYPMIEMWDAEFGRTDPAIPEALDRGDGAHAWELMHRSLDAVWRECARVVRAGGFICVNVGDATRSVGDSFRLYTNHARITATLEDLGMHSLPAVHWRKPTNAPTKFLGSGMLPGGAYVTLEHEYILIFRKGDRRKFDRADAQRRRESAFFWEERNVWFSDVWDLKGVRQPLAESGARARSGAFPVELATRLISMYSLQGDTVLDPFLGTGTTIIAAMATGRNSVGYETVAALGPVIRDGILAAASITRDITASRFRRHAEFVSERVCRGGTPLRHVSKIYGFPVMTRQEAEIRLLDAAAIEQTGPLSFRAEHRTAYPAEPQSTPPG